MTRAGFFRESAVGLSLSRATSILPRCLTSRFYLVSFCGERTPDLTIRNRFGGNALIPACERAHVEAVPLLLKAGIDVNHVNNLGWTCLLEIVILGDGGPRRRE